MPDQVGTNIGTGVVDRITHACLCTEMSNARDGHIRQCSIKRCIFGKVRLDKAERVPMPRFEGR